MQGAAGSVSFREVARAWYFEPQHLAPNVDPGGLEVTAGYRAARDSGTVSYTHLFLVYAASITVPSGFTTDNLPTGITFFGRPYSEPTLLKLAYAYEQATHHRAPPRTTPALP